MWDAVGAIAGVISVLLTLAIEWDFFKEKWNALYGGSRSQFDDSKDRENINASANQDTSNNISAIFLGSVPGAIFFFIFGLLMKELDDTTSFPVFMGVVGLVIGFIVSLPIFISIPASDKKSEVLKLIVAIVIGLVVLFYLGGWTTVRINIFIMSVVGSSSILRILLWGVFGFVANMLFLVVIVRTSVKNKS